MSVSCPDGLTLAGVGAFIAGANGKAVLGGIMPTSNLKTGLVSAWEAVANNDTWAVVAHAYCGETPHNE